MGFLCFRPPSTIEIDDTVDCSADHVLSLISAARLQNKKTLDSSINQPPTTSRRSLATVLKALVFQTSTSKRVREAKSCNRSEEQPTVVADPEIAVAPSPAAVEGAAKRENGGGLGGKINPVALVVLLSLLGTVFCGRLCAVMTTTVWIYAWRSGALVGIKGKRYFHYKRKVMD